MMGKRSKTASRIPVRSSRPCSHGFVAIDLPDASELPAARFGSHADVNLETLSNLGAADTTPFGGMKRPKTMSSFELPALGTKTLPMRRGGQLIG